jgi:hypothetical protein
MKFLGVSRPVSAARWAVPIAAVLLIAGAAPSAGSPLRAEPLAQASEAAGTVSLREAGEIKELDRRSSGKPARGSGSTVGTLEAAACFTANISCNSTIAGQLTTDDCRLPADESFYDAWAFQATAGDVVRINMAAGYDTYLFLLNPQGGIAARNDDANGMTLNSQIDFTINATGTWTIYANAFEPGDTGPYSLDLACTFVNPPPPPPTCTSSSTALCLNQERFQVQVSWSVPSQGTAGVGTAAALTSDTGYFWFFSSNNIELVVKVVDGRAFNNYFWVFYGALSDVQYTITVTDTATGATKTYSNSQGQLASVADVIAFPGGTAKAPSTPPADHRLEDVVRSESRNVARLLSAAAPLVCQADATTLCVNAARFQVRVDWRVPSQGTSGVGRAVPLTSDTGYFWFFSANNVELVLKVVDGRAFNGFFWVFYGALSDVEYTITVTDTVSGAVKTYTNPQGRLASVADVIAF